MSGKTYRTMKDLPRVFEKPIHRDPFFWLFLGNLAFWTGVLVMIFR